MEHTRGAPHHSMTQGKIERWHHESINNLIPADAYFGRGQTVLLERERIKRKTHRKSTLASPSTSCLTSQTRCANALLNRSAFCSKILDDGQDALRVAGQPE
jgi:hypothetical protein